MRTGKLRDNSTRGGIRERDLRAMNGWCGLTSHRTDSYTEHRARGLIRAKPIRVTTTSRVAGHASSRRGDSCPFPPDLLACARALTLAQPLLLIERTREQLCAHRPTGAPTLASAAPPLSAAAYAYYPTARLSPAAPATATPAPAAPSRRAMRSNAALWAPPACCCSIAQDRRIKRDGDPTCPRPSEDSSSVSISSQLTS